MAEGKKYKLGDLEFETEQEYREAAGDLKKIKGLMEKYDVSDPETAKRILGSVRAHPEAFRSPYGRRFVERLEIAAGKQQTAVNVPEPADTGDTKKDKKKKERPVREKRQKQPKEKKEGSTGIQIFTVRNFVIGIIIIVGIVLLSIFGPKLFPINSGGSDSNSDIKRNMVTAYAKGQADLKSQLYTYYFNVVGETEEEAMKDAEEGIGAYVLDLSDRTISTMTDPEVADIYKQLVDGGDIQNNSFVEPSDITVLKEKLLAAGLSDRTGNGTEGETSVEAAINSMMEYQERIHYSLCYNYSLLGFEKDDCEAYAVEDMDAMFGDVIYDFNMTSEDKQNYFDSFLRKGLIKDNQVVRFSTDPTAYNLPDLTPVIEVSIRGADARSFQCSMISYTPAASVFYEIHSDKGTGYICFRNNGDNTRYIPLDEDTSVTAQGDFFLLDGEDTYKGEWFYNKQDIGLFMDGDQTSKVSYVHDLTY